MSPAGPGPLALDGGWGWVVVACSFLALLLGYGSPQTVGVLYPEWLLAFGEGKGMTAWVGSLVAGVGLIVGPVCSVCVVNFGARPVAIFSGLMVSGGLILSAFAPNVPFLVFSYGIMVGVGVGLLYTAIITVVCLYFDKKRGLALGIMSTGTSVGGVVYATLQSELIERFGLDGCLLVVGALALNVVACAGPMRPLTPPRYHSKQCATIREHVAEEQWLQDEKEELSAKDPAIVMETEEQLVRRRSSFSCSAFIKWMKLKIGHYLQCLASMLSFLQDRSLIVLCITLLVYTLGNSPPQLLLEDLARSSKLSEGVTPVCLVAYSIGGGVGKLGLGAMADVPCVDGTVLYALTVGVSGLAVVLLPLSSSYLGLQVISLVLGFMSGNWTLLPYITSQVVGVERFTEAYGILMFFGGIGITLGPPLVGTFYDFIQSYDIAFYLSGGCMMASSLALFLTAVIRQTKASPHPPPPVSLLT